MNFKLDTRKINENLRLVAVQIIKQIVTNANNSVDMQGNPLTDYSDAYVKAKARYQTKGKTPNYGRASKVNMKLTGKMLRSIKYTKMGNTYEIYFSDPDRANIAYIHQMGRGVPKREFFGVSKQQEKQIFERYFKRGVLS